MDQLKNKGFKLTEDGEQSQALSDLSERLYRESYLVLGLVRSLEQPQE